jgi:hypothetical protein
MHGEVLNHGNSKCLRRISKYVRYVPTVKVTFTRVNANIFHEKNTNRKKLECKCKCRLCGIKFQSSD